jgi:hypothetical protein
MESSSSRKKTIRRGVNELHLLTLSILLCIVARRKILAPLLIPVTPGLAIGLLLHNPERIASLAFGNASV